MLLLLLLNPLYIDKISRLSLPQQIFVSTQGKKVTKREERELEYQSPTRYIYYRKCPMQLRLQLPTKVHRQDQNCMTLYRQTIFYFRFFLLNNRPSVLRFFHRISYSFCFYVDRRKYIKCKIISCTYKQYSFKYYQYYL